MEKLSVVAISSGFLDGTAAEFLEHAVDLAGKEHDTNVLLIPTAKTTQETYDKSISSCTDLYERQFGLPTRVLHEFNQFPDLSESQEKLGWADIVYIAGGDTDRMMHIWSNAEFDQLLKNRALGGLVLSGVSAGAIAPFTWGHSDSLSYRVADDEDWEYIPVAGLDLVRGAITPHYNTLVRDIPRSDMFFKMFEAERTARKTAYGFGIDNLAAIEIREGLLRSMSVSTEAGVTVLDGRSDAVTAHRLTSDESIRLDELAA
jgi:dipeptidase E